ncbi:hypothetical protein BK659_07445 [Pseudomonas brassicacearum]|uniref:Uncharacterized protein n=1 Tax=Pseudomonas brassicacearum TaxID=930166 RepID=A0A423H980_9PSED|nr:hypothetical protein BK659_07445 [Pseudomonas brassicacearum]
MAVSGQLDQYSRDIISGLPQLTCVLIQAMNDTQQPLAQQLVAELINSPHDINCSSLVIGCCGVECFTQISC